MLKTLLLILGGLVALVVAVAVGLTWAAGRVARAAAARPNMVPKPVPPP
mgnify:CR=1 FL=1